MPHWVITWADWCGAKFTLGTNYEPSFNGAAEIQFAVRYCRPSESALCKLCININQPYLIWAAVFCRRRHVPPTKDQGYWDQQSKKNQDVDMYSPWSCCCFCWWWSLELLQRWSPASQLKSKLLNIFAVSTNIVLCDKNNNYRTWDPRYDEI